MNRVVFEKSDGSVAVIVPAPGVAAEEAARAVPAGLLFEVFHSRDLPGDRDFRDAWRLAPGPAVVVDMERARAIHLGRIRSARNRELARLDIEQLKGIDVAAEKQRLRDLPATFDPAAATTPEELKSLWPDDLPR